MDNNQEETYLLGATLIEDKGCFSIYATQAETLVLEVYETVTSRVPLYKKLIKKEENVIAEVFSTTVSGIQSGMAYVWRICYKDYSYSPTLLDPYCKSVIFYEGEWRNQLVSAMNYKAEKPNIPWNNTIIYELHVGHFTKNDYTIEKSKQGTFLGLKEKLGYFKDLGITSLELLPIFKWNANALKNVNPNTGELLHDVWGYNPISFFAVDERYGTSAATALNEFKALVEAAHEIGLEIILDVVYNHTGEGGSEGEKFHFKYLAPEVYYRFNENHEYLNCSGTGNTLNTNHPIVKKMIKESLSYWANEVGVDGFRFDLASILGQDEHGVWLNNSLLVELGEEEALKGVKLISESWDAKGCYDVGRMPEAYREWSDYFRDTMRKFVKGEQGIIRAVTSCLIGKEVFFTNQKKGTNHTIHLISAHDGFTMWDMVSYNEKHNLANGENNRDGHNANYSYNWGVEGETQEETINLSRIKAVKNLMCFLILSKGVPMLYMGDEMGRTQLGNNNAYCQDNESVWVDWERKRQFISLTEFVKQLITLRKHLDYYQSEENYDISWHGVKLGQPDSSYYSRSIACYMKGKESLFLIANSYHEPLCFELPAQPAGWECFLDSSLDWEYEQTEIYDKQYLINAYSIVLLKARAKNL